MRYRDFKIAEAEDPNSWSQKDLGSVIDWINLHNAAYDEGWDMPIDDPIVILGLVGDPALGIMDDWKAFAGDTPSRCSFLRYFHQRTKSKCCISRR